jgi:hypothetical protein
MKIISRLFAGVYMISCYAICNAQSPAQWSAFQQRELKGCAYIFEGKVTQQSGKAITCSVVQITKIYKGNPQIKLGSIKVITTITKNGSEKFPQLIKGHQYIIFGSTTSTDNSNAFQSVVADNSLTLQTNDWVVYTDTGAVWGWRKPTVFPTKDSLNSYLKSNGIIVQEETQQK